MRKILFIILMGLAATCLAGGQLEEPLSNSVKALMQKSISDLAAPKLVFDDPVEGEAWLA